MIQDEIEKVFLADFSELSVSNLTQHETGITAEAGRPAVAPAPPADCRWCSSQLTMLTISHSDYRVPIPAQWPVQPSHKLPART